MIFAVVVGLALGLLAPPPVSGALSVVAAYPGRALASALWDTLSPSDPQLAAWVCLAAAMLVPPLLGLGLVLAGRAARSLGYLALVLGMSAAVGAYLLTGSLAVTATIAAVALLVGLLSVLTGRVAAAAGAVLGVALAAHATAWAVAAALSRSAVGRPSAAVELLPAPAAAALPATVPPTVMLGLALVMVLTSASAVRAALRPTVSPAG